MPSYLKNILIVKIKENYTIKKKKKLLFLFLHDNTKYMPVLISKLNLISN